MKTCNSDAQTKLTLAAAMVIFGTIGLLRRLIDLPSAAITCCRGLLGCLFLFLLQCLRGRKPDWAALRPKLWLLLLSGGMIGFNWMLLFEAYRYTTVAAATLCYYMAPVLLIAASPVLFGERLTGGKLLCVVLAVFGMVLVSGVLDGGALPAGTGTGIALGLGAAVLYASVMIITKKLSALNAYDTTIVQLGAAGAVMIPYLLVTGELASVQISLRSVLLLLVVSIVHTGLPYAMYFGAIGRLPAQTVALMSYLDPITALLLSALVLHEHLSVFGMAGAALILGATVLSDLLDRRQARQNP